MKDINEWIRESKIKELQADCYRLGTERAAHFERAEQYKGSLEVAGRVIGGLRSQVDSLQADVAALNDGWEATKAELEIERRRPVPAMMTANAKLARVKALLEDTLGDLMLGKELK